MVSTNTLEILTVATGDIEKGELGNSTVMVSDNKNNTAPKPEKLWLQVTDVSLDGKIFKICGRACLGDDVEQVLSSLPRLADRTARIYDYALGDFPSKKLSTYLSTYFTDNDLIMPTIAVAGKSLFGALDPKVSAYQVDDIRWQWSDGRPDPKSYSSILTRTSISAEKDPFTLIISYENLLFSHLKCCPVEEHRLIGMCLPSFIRIRVNRSLFLILSASSTLWFYSWREEIRFPSPGRMPLGS
jgi:hypothetical protein